ncbi:hypothetical protein DFH09DRAFT_1090089, partial [Mycena vulgaris]
MSPALPSTAGPSCARLPPPDHTHRKPPPLVDLTNAHDYNQGLKAAAKHGPGGLPTPTASDIAEGLISQNAIIQLVEGNARLVSGVGFRALSAFETKSGSPPYQFAIIRAQFANGQCATEHQAPSEDVPFTSGDDPAAAPHNLPAIRNSDLWHALIAINCTRCLVLTLHFCLDSWIGSGIVTNPTSVDNLK